MGERGREIRRCLREIIRLLLETCLEAARELDTIDGRDMQQEEHTTEKKAYYRRRYRRGTTVTVSKPDYITKYIMDK